MRNKRSILIMFMLIWVLVSLSCATLFGQGGNEESEGINLRPESDSEAVQDEIELVEVRQWAVSAEATSEYTDDDWSAGQAAGPPDTSECGDFITAWASYDPDTVEMLTVYYETPVYVTSVVVHETFVPGQVTKIEVIDVDGGPHQVFAQPAHEGSVCPNRLTAEFPATDFLVDAVRITVDQSVLGTWTEIDAVELVGVVAEKAPPPFGSAPQPAVQVGDLEIPGEVSWMINEDSSGMEFGTFGDIAVSDDGRIFVPDNGNGILVFDLDGKYLDLFAYDGFVNPTNVKIGPDDNLYISDWGADRVFIFSMDGQYISEFGESGKGPGQFGTFGPKAMAVGPGNIIFVIDDNRDENDDPYQRLMWFTKKGKPLGEYQFPSSGVFPVGMDFGPDGYLYIVNYFGGVLQKWDENGNYLGDIAGEALARTSPQFIDFDRAGNMYVTVWDDPGVVFLDAGGNYIGRFGTDEDPDVSPWPSGAMNQPLGIAVLPDGSQVFFTDYANQQPFLEALDVR